MMLPHAACLAAACLLSVTSCMTHPTWCHFPPLNTLHRAPGRRQSRAASCSAARDDCRPPPEQQPPTCSRRALLAGAAAAAASVTSTAGPQPALASHSCSTDAPDAFATQAVQSVGSRWPPAYAADGSAAAAQPVWDLAAADNGGIKQPPAETSELLPFSAADAFSPAQARVGAYCIHLATSFAMSPAV